MLSMVKQSAKRIGMVLLQALPLIVHVIKLPYWATVRTIIWFWGKRGLHSITVGEFWGGRGKRRSSYREEMLLKTLLLFVNLKGRTCLDLACNDGFWSFRLARFGLSHVTGIDTSGEALARANFLKQIYDFPNFQFKNKDIFEFLKENGSKAYDVVLLLSVIYHLPEGTNWASFFAALAQMTSECLVVDSRWFDDHDYWYDTSSSDQAILHVNGGIVKKWRPLRTTVFNHLHECGYEKIVEVNPSAFLSNPKEAFGSGDPYALDNVADYLTNHRSLIIAYKRRSMQPDIQGRLEVRDV